MKHALMRFVSPGDDEPGFRRIDLVLPVLGLLCMLSAIIISIVF